MISSKNFMDPLDSNWESEVMNVPSDPSPSIAISPKKTTSEPNIDQRTHRTEEIILDSESSILVEVTDALSEKEKVKYTIRSQTKLPDWFADFSVVREHEEFIWLHNSLEENDAYAAFIIPPAPPKPSFSASQLKLQKLALEENNMTKDEFARAKQDLEQEYLALFKKTVAMHEVYLQRLAAHPVIRMDQNFKIFLQYDQELSVRSRNTKEVVGSLWKKVATSTDQLVLNGHKDPEYVFELQRSYIVEYYQHISHAASCAEKVIRLRQRICDLYSGIGATVATLSRNRSPEYLLYVHPAVADWFNRMKRAETKSVNDEELKLADTLAYFTRDTQSAKDLFYRRLRVLTNYENANKALERARAKNKDIVKAEEEQISACKKFEEFSVVAKTELLEFKKRRVAAFVGNLKGLVELEIKNQKAQIQTLQECLTKLNEVL